MENISIPEALGLACRIWRVRRGRPGQPVTQGKLIAAAKAAGYDLSPGVLTAIEGGADWPPRAFAAVCAGLGVEGGELMKTAAEEQSRSRVE